MAVLLVPVGAAGPEPFDPMTEIFSPDGGAASARAVWWRPAPADTAGRALIPLPDRLPEV